MKKLYTFILGTFLPLLLATYSVCLFILLMQFLWQFVNDMVGKGVGVDVMAKCFFYASLAFTPQALPLAILLASLMTFGNLGEHLELLAMKASGISLLRIMKPIIYFVVAIAAVSFYFQNEIVPQAYTKMYTIVLSLRQKSPELDIPEGSFYKEITGYNVYVRHKDRKNGLLRDLMIYDYSKGFENAVVIVADSGKLDVSADKNFLILTLHSGELFENMGNRKARNLNEKIPYRRETFRLRTILIAFNTNFTLADESIMGSRDVGKSMNKLTTFIDSVRHEQDSIHQQTAVHFKNNIYGSVTNLYASGKTVSTPDTLFAGGLEAYFNRLSTEKKIRYLQSAKSRTERIKMDYDFQALRQTDAERQLLAHLVQLYKRFAMALSCILFFFIGAPLGAIIRKGGLGMPATISVILYILYYVINSFGEKMVKQSVWPVWEGVWLSTVFLAGLGIFFTYQAVNEAPLINPDAWKNILQKRIRKRKNQENQ